MNLVIAIVHFKAVTIAMLVPVQPESSMKLPLLVLNLIAYFVTTCAWSFGVGDHSIVTVVLYKLVTGYASLSGIVDAYIETSGE